MTEDLFQGALPALGKAQVDIARLESEVAHLTQGMAELKASNAALTKQLAEVAQILSEARGGWRVLMLVGGMGVALGSAAAWVIAHVKVSP